MRLNDTALAPYSTLAGAFISACFEHSTEAFRHYVTGFAACLIAAPVVAIPAA